MPSPRSLLSKVALYGCTAIVIAGAGGVAGWYVAVKAGLAAGIGTGLPISVIGGIGAWYWIKDRNTVSATTTSRSP